MGILEQFTITAPHGWHDNKVLDDEKLIVRGVRESHAHKGRYRFFDNKNTDPRKVAESIRLPTTRDALVFLHVSACLRD